MDQSEVKHFPKVDHTPAELDEESRFLLKVANLIETHGHAKCALGAPGKGFCLVGAAHYVSDGDVMGALAREGYAALYERFGRAIGDGLVSWNNAPERTKDEVVAKLRAVALGG